MDFTLIWFPILSGAVTAGLLYGAYYFLSRKKYKVGAWYIGLLIFFWVFTPYRYDGTNSVERNVVAQELRTQEYKEVQGDKVIVKTSVPDFATRMAIENARSLNANKVVADDIVK